MYYRRANKSGQGEQILTPRPAGVVFDTMVTTTARSTSSVRHLRCHSPKQLRRRQRLLALHGCLSVANSLGAGLWDFLHQSIGCHA
eukprot:423521-Pleurochrysis_carterae.AAC.5